ATADQLGQTEVSTRYESSSSPSLGVRRRLRSEEPLAQPLRRQRRVPISRIDLSGEPREPLGSARTPRHISWVFVDTLGRWPTPIATYPAESAESQHHRRPQLVEPTILGEQRAGRSLRRTSLDGRSDDDHALQGGGFGTMCRETSGPPSVAVGSTT